MNSIIIPTSVALSVVFIYAKNARNAKIRNQHNNNKVREIIKNKHNHNHENKILDYNNSYISCNEYVQNKLLELVDDGCDNNEDEYILCIPNIPDSYILLYILHASDTFVINPKTIDFDVVAAQSNKYYDYIYRNERTSDYIFVSMDEKYFDNKIWYDCATSYDEIVASYYLEKAVINGSELATKLINKNPTKSVIIDFLNKHLCDDICHIVVSYIQNKIYCDATYDHYSSSSQKLCVTIDNHSYLFETDVFSSELYN